MTINRKPVTLQDIFFFVVLVGLSTIFYQMLRPFLVDLFLTLVLSILFQRVYLFLHQRRRWRASSAAIATITAVVFTIVLPLIFVGGMVATEVSLNYDLVQTEWPVLEQRIRSGEFNKLIDNYPQVKEFVDRIDTQQMQSQLQELATQFTKNVLVLAQETVLSFTNMLFHTLMIIFFLYFFLTQGAELQARLQFLIPFDDANEREFMQRMREVTSGIIFNTFLVGLIEGTWGGILLAIAGVPSPFFWGTLMVVLSVIPLVGANTVLLPAAIILLSIGHTWQGLLILILGTGAIAMNQNFIKPRLDGRSSGMHPAIVVIASIGGMFWMGLIGFLAGPFLAAGFLVVWDQFGKRYEAELLHGNSSSSPTLPPTPHSEKAPSDHSSAN